MPDGAGGLPPSLGALSERGSMELLHDSLAVLSSAAEPAITGCLICLSRLLLPVLLITCCLEAV